MLTVLYFQKRISVILMIFQTLLKKELKCTLLNSILKFLTFSFQKIANLGKLFIEFSGVIKLLLSPHQSQCYSWSIIIL